MTTPPWHQAYQKLYNAGLHGYKPVQWQMGNETFMEFAAARLPDGSALVSMTTLAQQPRLLGLPIIIDHDDPQRFDLDVTPVGRTIAPLPLAPLGE